MRRRTRLKIAQPCRENWDGMQSDGVTRYCRSCKENVTDLSAMAEDEAFAFLEAGGQACVRVSYDDAGRVLFSNARSLLPRVAAAALLSVGAVSGSGCMMGKPASCPVAAPMENAAQHEDSAGNDKHRDEPKAETKDKTSAPVQKPAQG